MVVHSIFLLLRTSKPQAEDFVLWSKHVWIIIFSAPMTFSVISAIIIDTSSLTYLLNY